LPRASTPLDDMLVQRLGLRRGTSDELTTGLATLSLNAGWR
jgi:hypothetical protein